MLSACTAAQKPYALSDGTTGGAVFSGTLSDTAAGACRAAGAGFTTDFNGHTCVNDGYKYLVIQLCEPFFDGNPYDYEAGGALWAFALTGVLGLYFGSHLIGLVVKAVRNM